MEKLGKSPEQGLNHPQQASASDLLSRLKIRRRVFAKMHKVFGFWGRSPKSKGQNIKQNYKSRNTHVGAGEEVGWGEFRGSIGTGE